MTLDLELRVALLASLLRKEWELHSNKVSTLLGGLLFLPNRDAHKET